MAQRVIWAAVLLAYGVSTGAATNSGELGLSASSPLPLDMAPDSVDDRYDGCRKDMAEEATGVLQNERNKDRRFNEAWAKAEEHYKNTVKPKLGREQAIAIYVYAFISGDLYRPFNAAVRTQGPQYQTTFNFRALHFYLTDAIQLRRLKASKGQGRCLTVYRRVDRYFRQDVVNTQVRFGSFTSSSKSKDLERFGNKSCFEIITCMGADISMLSRYENEAEVLIPPYEVFKVTEVKERSEEPGLPCEVVYKLKSTGKPLSNFNCAFFKK